MEDNRPLRQISSDIERAISEIKTCSKGRLSSDLIKNISEKYNLDPGHVKKVGAWK